VPAITHEEFFVLANYNIVLEDTESNEWKIANYAELRREAYGPLGEQLDMQFKSFDNWKKHIADVKARFPKA
jgi:hypothetical protein